MEQKEKKREKIPIDELSVDSLRKSKAK